MRMSYGFLGLFVIGSAACAGRLSLGDLGGSGTGGGASGSFNSASGAGGRVGSVDPVTAGTGNSPGATSGGKGNSGGGNSAGVNGDWTDYPGLAASGGAGNAGRDSGGAGAGSALGPSVCDGAGSRILTNTPADAFIDDFEKVAMGSTDTTFAGPGWYSYSDLGPAGADPSDSSCGATGLVGAARSVCNENGMFKISRTAGMGAAATAFFGEYEGTGANVPPTPGAFGVGVEMNVGDNPTALPPQYCVDASVFTGVSFWAKVGNAANATVVANFVIPSQNVPTPALVEAGAPDADCTSVAAGACYNFPQKTFALSTVWKQYTINFAEVTGATGAKIVHGRLQQLMWLAPTTNWDFSLDEIAFYNGTPPAGPVAPPTGSGGSGGSN
jgi:hypothetical protein